MAFGIAEDPGNNPVAQLDSVEYPIWRELLVQIAADNGATADVINLFKCLPESRYASKDQVLRDLGEASRRFAMSNQDRNPERDRRDIGREGFNEGKWPGERFEGEGPSTR